MYIHLYTYIYIYIYIYHLQVIFPVQNVPSFLHPRLHKLNPLGDCSASPAAISRMVSPAVFFRTWGWVFDGFLVGLWLMFFDWWEFMDIYLVGLWGISYDTTSALRYVYSGLKHAPNPGFAHTQTTDPNNLKEYDISITKGWMKRLATRSDFD